MVFGDGNIRPRRYRRPGSWRQKADLRVLVPLGVPVALGLALAIVLALSGGSANTKLSPSALNSGVFLPGAPAAVPPVPPDCSVIVPLHPLTAHGLASPWLLAGPGGSDPNGSGCTQTNPNLEAFVQATIINPATGHLSVYEPLVITAGTKPAIAPVVPKLPKGAVVDIMIGFNGNNLQLLGAAPDTLLNNHCVNGLGASLFGQVSYCDSGPFYAAANAAIASGLLKIPSNGFSPVSGQQCPTTRSFDIVDQDQSDNVTTQYLLTGTGQTAQDNAANRAALQQGSAVINNGSDNALLDFFVLPALGCTPFTAPDLSNGGVPGTSQTLDELSAMENQHVPRALVPENDTMVLVNQQFSVQKTNLYRIGVGQPFVSPGTGEAFKFNALLGPQTADTPGNYCANMLNIQTPFIASNMATFQNLPSPVPAVANSLYTFLAARLSASFMNLNCQNFGLVNTVKTVTNGDVVVAAQFSLAQQQPTSGSGGTPVSAPVTAPAGASASATPGMLPSPSASALPSPSPSQDSGQWPWGQYSDYPGSDQSTPWWWAQP